MSETTKKLLEIVDKRDPHQKEFRQAVEEVLETIQPVFQQNPKYVKIMERLLEPERVIQFRVAWIDDKGVEHVDRGFRVQFNSAIGPYKGGLRFHPSVNLSIIKFLGFEQTFKNALTGLPLGGAKGGSSFNPKKKSDREIMNFCQAFMTELSKHIGAFTDVPAGDIGVGAREIGYLFGQYKRIKNRWEGTLTGKGTQYGGSLGRTEATGYGLLWFVKACLEDHKDSLEGKVCAISGAGNVAIFAAEKAIELKAKVVSLSDSNGFIYASKGLTKQQLEHIKELKFVKRDRLKQHKLENVSYHEGSIWDSSSVIKQIDIALPCATQNEINEQFATKLIEQQKIKYLFEGANLPTTNEAVALIKKSGVIYGPSKACNAGGVATSGFEMSQNAQRLLWKKERVFEELEKLMKNIYKNCKETAKKYGKDGDLQVGANIAGFIRVADSMIAEGTY